MAFAAEGPKPTVLGIQQKSFDGRVRLQALFAADKSCVGSVIRVAGWSRSVRKQGGGLFCFVVLTDGSTSTTLQVVVSADMPEYATLLKCGAGCCFTFEGELVESPAAGQAIEMKVHDPTKHTMIIHGTCDASAYPLAKKKHGTEFLRDIAHLRPRSFLIGAVMRIRSQMAMATHSFFQGRGFNYIHTPLITAADCEGAGEMFQVTTLMGDKVTDIPTVKPSSKKGGAAAPEVAGKKAVDGGVASPAAAQPSEIDYSKEFFGKKTFLTVSGQLALESFACSLCDVYTFGPTFRAENSHTSRHLAEFWMIEPEMAFCDLAGNMQCAEAYLKHCVQWALDNCLVDLQWLDTNVESGLVERLRHIVAAPFAHVAYTEAVEILRASNHTFTVAPEWGMDLGAEHERYLTEQHFKKPTIVFDYPSDLKAFYMRQNEDGKTTAAMDVLLPKIGEVIGGSQREERLDVLEKMIEKKGLEKEAYWWYLDLRRFGSVPHSGFGLGFERLVMLVTGVDNIRDVIPFPRYPGHADF